MSKRVPTTVFSGFLGSGKTTLISSLIDNLQAQNVQVAYIKNEIGDTDIDTKLFQGKDIQTKELLNGCICCTLVGPFAAAVSELIAKFHPDRIIIEASGAADPSAIALMISSHPELRKDGIVSVVDVLNFEGYKDLSNTAQRQTQFTDLIIFNKVEEATLEQKKRVVGYVRELNNQAPIIEAPKGVISPELVLGIDSKNLDDFLKKYLDAGETDHIDHDHFSAFTLSSSATFSQEGLYQFLTSLPKALFRTKGIFKNNQQEWISFNGVGQKVNFEEMESTEHLSESIFVFIGIHADNYKDEVSKKLQQTH